MTLFFLFQSHKRINNSICSNQLDAKMRYLVRFPKWSMDLAYFCGLIVGDGSLPKGFSKRPNGKIQRRYEISFVSKSLEFIKNVYQPLFENLFNIKPYVVRWKDKHKSEVFYCRIESKILYNFLTNKIGMTSGRKARTVSPIEMPEKYKIHFLAGLLDTDGGKKGSGFGISTASERLSVFIKMMFSNLDVKYHYCPWKFNGHLYHQIYLNKEDSIKILEIIPLRNMEKVEFLKCLSGSAW